MGRTFGFVTTFFILFAITVAFMAMVDALPEEGSSQPQVYEPATGAPQGTPEEPTRIVIAELDIDSQVLNPTSTDVEALDEALLKGAIRYPATSLLGEDGTLLLFGHSSYLPIVHNPNYKAFNGIQKLKPGAIISVYSAGAEYRFAVTGVRLANANEDIVELPSDRQYLTLVTCDSFASKADRFVVTAVRVL